MHYAEIDREWKKITLHCDGKEEFDAWCTVLRTEIRKGNKLKEEARKENG